MSFHPFVSTHTVLSRAIGAAVAALVATTISALPAAAVEPFSGPTLIVGSTCASGVGDAKWWAVWHEMVGGQAELFQARTLLGSQHRTRITVNPPRM